MSDRVRQFERQRKFECGGKVSTTLQDVLPEQPVVRRYWREPQFRYPHNHQTVFSKVDVCPYAKVPEAEEYSLASMPSSTVEEDLASFCRRFVDAMLGYFREYWRQGGVHIVFYEGDYAGRIVSFVLRRLYQEWGNTRFGTVLFCVYGPMCDQIEPVLQHEGWDASQYVMLRDEREWLYPPVDISSGKYFNGSQRGYPVCYATLVAALKKKGVIPECSSLQVVSSFGDCYTILGANAVSYTKLGPMMSRLYYSPYSIPLGGADDVLYPVMSYDVVKVAITTSVKRLYWDMVEVVRVLDGKLAEFPKVGVGDLYPCDWATLPDDVFNAMCEQYRKSWYGQEVFRNGASKYATRTTSDNPWTPWYSLWTAAAYCEHLIQCGYKLMVAG